MLTLVSLYALQSASWYTRKLWIERFDYLKTTGKTSSWYVNQEREIFFNLMKDITL